MNINNISYALSEEELLKRMRLLRFMEPLHEGDIREDSDTAERWLREHLRREYMELLLTTEADRLPLIDLTADVTVEKTAPGIREIILPKGTLAVTEIKMKGDLGTARIVNDGSACSSAQRSQFARGGECEPIAIAHQGGRITVYGGRDEESDEAERVMGVRMPENGVYMLTPQIEQELTKRLSDYENR